MKKIEWKVALDEYGYCPHKKYKSIKKILRGAKNG